MFYVGYIFVRIKSQSREHSDCQMTKEKIMLETAVTMNKNIRNRSGKHNKLFVQAAAAVFLQTTNKT